MRISPDYKHLVQSLLEPNPKTRLSLGQLQSHEWMQRPVPPQDYITHEMQKRKKIIQKANESDSKIDIENCKLKLNQKNELNTILKRMGTGTCERECDPYLPSIVSPYHFFTSFNPSEIEEQIKMHL